jgi:hypothetical protein
MEVSRSEVRGAKTRTFLFGNGRVPGSPMQTGQMLLFGRLGLYLVEQLQYALVSEASWQCTSIPMTASYFSRTCIVDMHVNHH